MDWFLYDRDLRHERVKASLEPQSDIFEIDGTFTTQNTVISPNLLVWKIGEKLHSYAFSQTFHARKLGEITAFCARCFAFSR